MTATMESTPQNLIGAMFAIQNSLNSRSYDKSWIEKGRTEEFDYAMAAGDEAHEFARSLPFQWWKDDAPDRLNQVTEIVDAWHFVMSQFIIDHNGNVDSASRQAVKLYEQSVYTEKHPSMTVKRSMKLFVAAMYAHNGPVYFNYHYVSGFFELCSAADVSLELLYARYLAKSELNKFRVANGYKRGEYLKIWEYGGMKGEDNFFLSTWVEERYAQGHTVSQEDVQVWLSAIYLLVKDPSLTPS